MRFVLLAGLALSALHAPVAAAQSDVAAVAPSQATSPRQVTELTDGWRFRKGGDDAQAPDYDDTDWAKVSVPHTWNRVGVYDAAAKVPGMKDRTIDKYKGVGWYRLTFDAPTLGKGKRAWLEFDAASRTAEVWLNGVKLGLHEGGFARFRFDATAAMRSGQPNILAVKVDNSQPAPGNATANTLPISGDFFVQGGLYRPARLLITDAAHFAMDDFGGSGVYARTVTASPKAATISVLSRLSNQETKAFGGRLVARLVDRQGIVSAEASSPVRLGGKRGAELTQSLEVAKPHLWQGVDDPYLYTLQLELYDAKGQVLDSVVQNFGVRTFRIDANKGFFINDKPVVLRGVGYHQDSMKSGWAMSEAETAERVATIRDMGANTIRLTHYQHGQPIHDLADRYGLVLWDEIALVTAWTLDEKVAPLDSRLAGQARQQLKELIRQNYNHPSVAVWSIANEVDFGPGRPDFLGAGIKADPADPTPLLEDLAALVIAEDPSRPATLATCCEGQPLPKVPDVARTVPVAGANRYFGWYYGQPADLGPHLDALHAKNPLQPQALTEYGAGGALSLHTDDPRGGPVDMAGRVQPEEYESWFHERSWPQIAERPFLWGSWLWNSFDFATATRAEGNTKDINTKGLVSYDGEIRKDAFYYYRAQWSAKPTVHVTGRRYVDRNYPATTVRVYSNAPSTSLSLNGRKLGERKDCPNRICTWDDVQLDAGENQVKAVGRFPTGEVGDAIVWNLAADKVASYLIDVGSILSSTVGYGSDAFFDGGTVASTDQHPRGRPVVKAPITPEVSHDLLASYREGSFAYRLPVQKGRYTVTLRFVEPSANPGDRVFSVTANGRPAITGLDLAKEAGINREIVRSFPVTVTNKGIDLQFVPAKGNAIVSAVEVRPLLRR